MTDQKMFEEYTGFTETEVKALCRQYDMDFDETNSWYDGYRLRTFRHIYNSKSVVEAMSCHHFSNFWTATETYEALKVYMDMDFDGLRGDIVQMLGGWAEVMRVLKQSEALLEDTLAGREQLVADALDRAHTEVASILTYNDENSQSMSNPNSTLIWCAIGLAYYSARKDYRLIRELPTGRGFADVVFLPLPHSPKPALIVELKYDKSADTAIQQIKEKRYTQALEGYSREILLVGINYEKDKENKRHRCVIERLRI